MASAPISTATLWQQRVHERFDPFRAESVAAERAERANSPASKTIRELSAPLGTPRFLLTGTIGSGKRPSSAGPRTGAASRISLCFSSSRSMPGTCCATKRPCSASAPGRSVLWRSSRSLPPTEAGVSTPSPTSAPSCAAPAPDSPFVVEAPLGTGAPSFVGRRQAMGILQQCLRHFQPVQLLGEHRMGRKSRWGRGADEPA